MLGCHTGGLTKINNNLEFGSPDEPAAVVQPDPSDVAIDFGQVGVQATKTLTIQFASNGAPIVLGALGGQPDAEFSLPLIPGTSVGTAPDEIVAAFAPTSLGDKTAVYTLATNATGAPLVTLTLRGQGVPQSIGVTPNPIAFGNVELHQVGTIAVTIANDGAAPASLQLSALAGANPSLFAVDPPSMNALPVGGSVTFQARFSPMVAGAASASFTLSGCATCGEFTVSLSGTGVESLVRVSPDPLHFGFLALDGGAIASVTVANIGNQSVNLSWPGPGLGASAAANGFSFGPPAASTPGSYPSLLAAGESAALPIAFAPPRTGFFSTSLSFGTDDVGAPRVVVPIDGYGGGARIACLPSALNFGATAVGQSQVQSVICTNVGTDVPGHPEAALQISAAGLTVDSPLFKAALAPDTTGMAEDGGVSLLAGQSAEIDVSYAPAAAENDTGTLTVASNDTVTPALSVALAGQGVVPGACTFSVVPGELSFGEVPAGSRGQQLFEIDNTGQTYCLLGDFALASGSDAAFSLPDGPAALLLGYGGNSSGEPAGPPTSVRVPVQFAPLASEAVASGSVVFKALGAPGGGAMGQVSLGGSSAAACLNIEPSLFDFGRVGFDPASGKSCVGETARFTVENSCAAPVTVGAIGLSSALDSVPQFALLDVPSLPLAVAPAAQFGFGASFAPTSAGLKAGAIALASSEFPSTSYQVSLLGDAEVSGQRTDTFTARANKVDLVFVLDDDDDVTEIQAVSQEMPDFIQAANAAQLDYRIALTSTDTCQAIPSDQGWFEPCAHCSSPGSGGPDNPIYLTPQSVNAAQTLQDLFSNHQATACQPSLVGDEHFFLSLAEAFDPTLLAGHNAGFLRDDAYLAIVVVNGDGEDDRSTSITTQQAIDMVKGLEPDPAMVSVSYIDDGLGALNQAYHMTALVQATGGAIIDTSSEWVPGFFDLLWAGERLGGFALSTTPDPSTLLVEENGVPFAAQSSGETVWSYDAATNAVVFTPQNLPVPGTLIAISYGISCE